MRTRAFTMSAGFHVAVLIVTVISLPWLKKDLVLPPPISVELVDISALTETNKVAPQPVPPEKKEEKKDDKPPPAPKNTSKEAVTPVPKDMVKDDKKDEVKKETVVVDKNAPPDKKKKPDEKVTEAAPKKDFSSVLKNLADPKKTSAVKETSDLSSEKPDSATPGQNAPLGAKMTMSEVDALRHQLEQCWNVPYGAKDVENMVVDIFMVINPDRTLREARIVDTSRYNSDTFFRAAAESAIRAVRNPKCSPFDLPPDKYDSWKTVTVMFNASDMF